MGYPYPAGDWSFPQSVEGNMIRGDFGNVNLTAEGTVSWWKPRPGGGAFDNISRKAGGASIDVSVLGPKTPTKNTFPNVFSWSDGDSPASGSSQATLSITEPPEGSGFRIAVGAPMAPDRLLMRIYVGGVLVRGASVASLSDGSASSNYRSYRGNTYEDSFTVFEYVFAAVDASRTLTADVINNGNSGDFQLAAVTLQKAPYRSRAPNTASRHLAAIRGTRRVR